MNRLGGQVIRLSPNSRDYVNPLDINLNYSEEENPLALKSDFVLSFCELIMGSKTGLEAIEKTVIDRAVQMIYQPYFADPPYELAGLETLPDLIFENNLLKEDGLFVLEHGKKNSFEEHPHFVERRVYGSVNFTIFK